MTASVYVFQRVLEILNVYALLWNVYIQTSYVQPKLLTEPKIMSLS